MIIRSIVMYARKNMRPQMIPKSNAARIAIAAIKNTYIKMINIIVALLYETGRPVLPIMG